MLADLDASGELARAELEVRAELGRRRRACAPSSRSSPTWTPAASSRRAELEVLADLDAGGELAAPSSRSSPTCTPAASSRAELEVLADLELARRARGSRRRWDVHRIRSTSGDLAAAIAELEVLADLDVGSELARRAAAIGRVIRTDVF